MSKPMFAVVLVVCVCAIVVGVRLAFAPQLIPPIVSNEDQYSLPVDKTSSSEPKPAEGVAQISLEDVSSQGWKELVDAPVELPTYIPDLEDQGFLSLNRNRLEGVSVGEMLEIWIPQEQQLLAIVVNTRDILASGNVLVKGFLDGDPDYPFVMTIGQTSTFATISTREAVYSLRGNRSVAWIASSAALKQHFPQKEQDYVIPKNS